MDDHELHGRFIAEVFGSIDAFGSSELYMLLRNPELAMDKGIEHFRLIQDSKGEGQWLYFIDQQIFESSIYLQLDSTVR
jgi:hypothetical protein